MRADPTAPGADRRRFVSSMAFFGVGMLGPLTTRDLGGQHGLQPPAVVPEDEEVSPAEDLMREQGVLKRALLVYGEAS